MNKPSQSHDESPAAKRGIRWDALAAIIASLVGLLALLVAGYTAYIEREQVRAQVWPYLLMGTSNANGDYEFVVINRGVGPALVKTVQVLVAGRPVANFERLMQAIGFKPTDSGFVLSTLNRVVIAPGQQLHWIELRNVADVDALKRDWVRSHVQARVCYASTLGESWLVVFEVGSVPVPRPVARCSVVPEAAQYRD